MVPAPATPVLPEPPDLAPFRPIAELRCIACGGAMGREGSVFALDGARLLPFCSATCGKPHGWPRL